MTTLLFPGSFDPFTRGHRDIARRAAHVCDKLYVVIMHNDSKKHLFTPEERVWMASESLKEYPNIEVLMSDGLLVDVFKEKKCDAVIRGIRSESDFRYEAEMAMANKLLYPEYDVMLFPCRDDLSLISSTIVKEVGYYGGDLSKMVPAEILDFISDRLKKGRT
ncbi:MAG: pantetheine-phosphate adenylyltransferase [Saccharofermentans sp.]|nr:pantetheine-phosphate adenylyltransferase [Saccharofermentans sp.]